MRVSWFYEGVFHSVVECGSGMFVSVMLMGVQICPTVTLGYPDLRWVGGSRAQPRCCGTDPLGSLFLL